MYKKFEDNIKNITKIKQRSKKRWNQYVGKHNARYIENIRVRWVL